MNLAISEPSRLDRVLAALRARFGAAEGECMAPFARALFTKGGEDYLDRLGDDEAVAVSAHAFRFLAAPGPVPRVRVFTPAAGVHGWESAEAVIETVMPDRPFIVDTVREYLRSEGLEIRHLVHPLVGTERADAAGPDTLGTLRAVKAPERGMHQESFLHVVVAGVPAERMETIEAAIAERLADVLLVTADFAAMVGRLEEVAQHVESYKGGGQAWDDEVQEVQEFLRWLARGGCVLLGCRTLSIWEREDGPLLAIDDGSGLGLFRKTERSHYASPTPIARIPEPVRSRIVGGPLLVITRTDAHSPVHRHARMDYIGVKKLDAQGKVRGEFRFVGLLTSKAFAEESAEVPILRRRLQQILQAEHVVRGSHDHKEIVAIFNSMPKAELFSVPVEALRADIRTIMSIQRTSEVHVTFRPDALERGVAVMVIVPREKFSGAIRARIQDALSARFGGQIIDYHLALGEGDQARLHFFLAAPRARVQAVRWDEVQRELAELMRGWDDRLRDRLIALHGDEEGEALAARWTRALPETYKTATDVPAALHDIRHLEQLRGGETARVDVTNPAGSRTETLTAITFYVRGDALVLSDVLPMLENLGLRVFAEDAVAIPDLDGGSAHVHAFLVQDTAGQRLDVRRHAERVSATVLAVRSGTVENDALNRLVLGAGLTWQEVDLLRTYCNYAFQIGVAPSRRALVDALVRHPAAAALLPRWFAARFDPAGNRAQTTTYEQAFTASLDAVADIGEDRILRVLFDLMEATVRTTFYKRVTGERDAIAVKIDCAKVEAMPQPRPLFEIYVHGPRMEGVHLRGGRVARGGIRFSDRPDDFRTEVLGLMKTQTVKNAVIVPTGAKGGFVVKGVRDRAAVERAYDDFVRALLDLTDNRRGDQVVPPPGLVCWDEPDPYLVVAADKGTATFSDRANTLAVDAGFWLGDAFASGGSNGYDHKKLGITARGAWECIRRHVRELDGRDVDRDPITVVGIGDMSGDVFGNGMLLSEAVRLRAAFDHRHVFLDPEPDPARAYAERRRLFALPRSSWADYAPDALGPGGMVVARGTKSVSLTPEVRAMLGTEAAAIDGDSLIQLVLRMPTDLLFNGGIGTYVKAAGETNAEVGDTANAAVRVNAEDVRARVIGEGGNLGLTQRGRIAFALGGGRINTDAIDNSAGVDMSDHEVNLKVALQPLLERGDLTLAQRNELLVELAPAVTELVLDHNRSQSRTISRDQRRSQTRIEEFRATMSDLEAIGLLDRALEGLPEREALRARRGTFLGLTRPELAVLLAYAKMACTRAIASDPLCDDPHLERTLFGYFPTVLGERFPDAVRGHRLRREIVVTTLTNVVVDLMGTTFLGRTARETGATTAEVVRATVVVEALTDARALAARAGEAGAEAEVALLDALLPALERAVRWMIETGVDGPIAVLVDRFRAPAAGVLQALPARVAARRREQAAALVAAGVPRDLADACADAAWLREVLDVVHLAAACKSTPAAAGTAYWHVNELVDVGWLRTALDGTGGEDRWERRAVEGLRAELDRVQRGLASHLLADGGDSEALARRFTLRHGARLAGIRTLLGDLKSAQSVGIAGLMVAVRELARLEGAS